MRDSLCIKTRTESASFAVNQNCPHLHPRKESRHSSACDGMWEPYCAIWNQLPGCFRQCSKHGHVECIELVGALKGHCCDSRGGIAREQDSLVLREGIHS
jgi:hypothetical protein